MSKSKLFLIFCSVFVFQVSFASRIDNAFDALKQFDYFKAKKLFYASMKQHKAAACYGLAIIYLRNDNPFHQLDSAYSNILRADSLYPKLTIKAKDKLAIHQVNSFAINALKEQVSTAFFNVEQQHPTENTLNAFLIKHPWSQEKFKAIHLRDSIAYDQALQLHTAVALSEFLAKYPATEYLNKAKVNFNIRQFEEETKNGTLTDYLNF